MPTDAEDWRFLADHALTLHTDGGDYGYLVHWCRTAGPGQPPEFYPVSNGETAEEAMTKPSRGTAASTESCPRRSSPTPAW
jgi:hypothetical protein